MVPREDWPQQLAQVTATVIGENDEDVAEAVANDIVVRDIEAARHPNGDPAS